MTFEVRNDIPLPTPTGSATYVNYPFKSMQPGESVEIPIQKWKSARAQASKLKWYGLVFTSRKTSETAVTFWRVS